MLKIRFRIAFFKDAQLRTKLTFPISLKLKYANIKLNKPSQTMLQRISRYISNFPIVNNGIFATAKPVLIQIKINYQKNEASMHLICQKIIYPFNHDA